MLVIETWMGGTGPLESRHSPQSHPATYLGVETTVTLHCPQWALQGGQFTLPSLALGRGSQVMFLPAAPMTAPWV